jgi:hypothetical protein
MERHQAPARDLATWCREQQLIFIGGCARSGTTWVQDLLLAHPRCFGPRAEIHLPVVFGLISAQAGGPGFRRSLLEYYDSQANRHMGLHHLVTREDLESMLDETSGIEEPAQQAAAIVAAVLGEYSLRQQRASEDVLVEKTPANIFIAPLLLKLFPRARLVEVVRDGRDVAVSMQFYRAMPTRDRAGQYRDWVEAIAAGERLQRSYAGRCLRVRYEDVHAAPEAALEQLFRFAELEHHPQLVRACVSQCRIETIVNKGPGRHVRAGRVGDWRAMLLPEECQLFEEVAGSYARALGYL